MTLVDSLDLDGRSVLVAGAGNALGAAIARACAAHGAGRIVLVDADADAVSRAAEALPAARAVAVDPCSLASLDAVRSQLEPCDLLVNVPWAESTSPFAELRAEEWSAALAATVKHVYAVCSIVVPGMVTRQSGGVVNVASIAGKRPGLPGASVALAGGMAGVNGVTKALARELAPVGVRVNGVNYGGLVSGAAPGEPARLGRAARGDEIGAAVVFLLSGASAYVTGETLNVDGGLALE